MHRQARGKPHPALGERTEIHVTDQVQPVTDDKPSVLPHDYLTSVRALCKSFSLSRLDFLIAAFAPSEN